MKRHIVHRGLRHTETRTDKFWMKKSEKVAEGTRKFLQFRIIFFFKGAINKQKTKTFKKMDKRENALI